MRFLTFLWPNSPWIIARMRILFEGYGFNRAALSCLFAASCAVAFLSDNMALAVLSKPEDLWADFLAGPAAYAKLLVNLSFYHGITS